MLRDGLSKGEGGGVGVLLLREGEYFHSLDYFNKCPPQQSTRFTNSREIKSFITYITSNLINSNDYLFIWLWNVITYD